MYGLPKLSLLASLDASVESARARFLRRAHAKIPSPGQVAPELERARCAAALRRGLELATS